MGARWFGYGEVRQGAEPCHGFVIAHRGCIIRIVLPCACCDGALAFPPVPGKTHPTWPMAAGQTPSTSPASWLRHCINVTMHQCDHVPSGNAGANRHAHQVIKVINPPAHLADREPSLPSPAVPRPGASCLRMESTVARVQQLHEYCEQHGPWHCNDVGCVKMGAAAASLGACCCALERRAWFIIRSWLCLRAFALLQGMHAGRILKWQLWRG